MNYYTLPTELQAKFTDSFLKEMDIVQPKVIIPVSKEVEQTLQQMRKCGKLKVPIAARLKHPYHCSIRTNYDDGKRDYLDAIGKHAGPIMQDT
ncbi:hypothetical protein [Ectobacillus ponti]|uniref:Uncharacterized protein n=1 Tax=Ectobacillus ponti TaxID=2961894 RepID=A0AA42BSY0_9BACI|nr:hypothetical protein [Ectobacillus ponti]MCP8971019.1 hypothetical protein [Ectobacillus ponti]